MENQQEAEVLIRKLDSTESMISVTIGRAITTLLSSRTKKLQDSIHRLSLDSTNKKPSLGTHSTIDLFFSTNFCFGF